MLRPTDQRILLATDTARALLAPDGAEVVGRELAEFTEAPTDDAVGLLVKGYLSGFQLRRVRAGQRAADLEIRVVGAGSPGVEPVLALVSQVDRAVEWASRPPAEHPQAIGWTDRHFLVQQLDERAERLVGRPAGEVQGEPLIGLVGPDGLAPLLFALGHLAGTGQAVSLPIVLQRADQTGSRCQLVLLASTPGYAFALQPLDEAFNGQPLADRPFDDRPFDEQPGLDRPDAVDPAVESALLRLRRFGQGLAAARVARELLQPRPDLPELTSRELQIVTRLLAGDRVPAISRQLYLAQSTVRNHLSAVFAKLGVRSQQELIVLLRRAQSAGLERKQSAGLERKQSQDST